MHDKVYSKFCLATHKFDKCYTGKNDSEPEYECDHVSDTAIRHTFVL